MTTRIGHVRVTRIAEAAPKPAPGFPDGATLAAYARHRESIPPDWYARDGAPMLGMSGFVLSDGTVNVLVDTCNGDWPVAGFPAAEAPSPFVERLRAAGYPPQDIHFVVNTHLHLDHVGNNTHATDDGGIALTFPNAEYLLVEQEWNAAREHAGHGHPAFGTVDRAVRPVIERGRARLVAPDHRITGAISLLPTPGHTAGHVSVQIVTAAGEGVITGDMAHHPIQLFEPGLKARYEEDSDEAVRSRERLLERWRRGDVLVLGTHFAGTGIGRLDRAPGGFVYTEVL